MTTTEHSTEEESLAIVRSEAHRITSVDIERTVGPITVRASYYFDTNSDVTITPSSGDIFADRNLTAPDTDLSSPPPPENLDPVTTLVRYGVPIEVIRRVRKQFAGTSTIDQRLLDDECAQKLEPDEPFFILLGRDVAAVDTLVQWELLRQKYGKSTKGIADIIRQFHMYFRR